MSHFEKSPVQAEASESEVIADDFELIVEDDLVAEPEAKPASLSEEETDKEMSVKDAFPVSSKTNIDHDQLTFWWTSRSEQAPVAETVSAPAEACAPEVLPLAEGKHEEKFFNGGLASDDIYNLDVIRSAQERESQRLLEKMKELRKEQRAMNDEKRQWELKIVLASELLKQKEAAMNEFLRKKETQLGESNAEMIAAAIQARKNAMISERLIAELRANSKSMRRKISERLGKQIRAKVEARVERKYARLLADKTVAEEPAILLPALLAEALLNSQAAMQVQPEDILPPAVHVPQPPPLPIPESTLESGITNGDKIPSWQIATAALSIIVIVAFIAAAFAI